MVDSLASALVVPRLRGRFGRPYVYAERTASTQRLLEQAAPEGAVAVAEEQTEGRGRLGRRWVAPARSSVLVSLLLRPTLPQSRWPELSLVAGHACAASIRAVAGLEPAIKEPNDVLVAGRKVAGILAEAAEGRVVLGVGVNVNMPRGELPEPTATSLSVELGRPVDRVDVLVTLLEQLELAYDAWLTRSRRPR